MDAMNRFTKNRSISFMKAIAFGSREAGSFAYFDERGHLRLFGDAIVYKDEKYDALAIKVQGTGVSTNAAESTQDFADNATLLDYLHGNIQLNHDRDPSQPILPHVHFFQAYDVAPNFLLQYRYQINGSAKATAWTSVVMNALAYDYGSGTLNQIAYVPNGIVVPATAGLSDIVQVRILRDNANDSGLFAGADGYTGDVGVLSCDIHVAINSLGSDSEYQKYDG